MNRGQGVLGQLTGDTPEAKELAAHIRRAARSIDEFSGRLNRGKGTLVQLVEDEAYARRVLANLDRTLADLAEVAAKLDRGEGTLGKLVIDPALYHEAKSLVGGVRSSWFLRFFGGRTPSGPPPAPEPGAGAATKP